MNAVNEDITMPVTQSRDSEATVVPEETDTVATTESTEAPINWLNVIRFHKDVIEKAEENVFALPIWRHDDERWSCIDGDHILDLIGEWTIPVSAIRSEKFLKSLAGPQVQSHYIGGACYMVRWNDGAGWAPHSWVPVVYKEVEIHLRGENILVTPKETGWNVSPQVLRSCTNKDESAPDILRAAVTKLCDSVQDIGGATPLHKAILDALFADTEKAAPVGFLPNDTEIPTGREMPSPWILFCPPQDAGGMGIHLARDYKKMEHALSTSEVPGGMRILAGGHPPFDKGLDGELHSPIPLTRSQRRAVSAIVNTENPLTVISGPPGTGKSQVVAAVLADCWKNGKSILFTSTNNKAVNVVRERVDDLFKYPMVVRTGNPHAETAGVDTVHKLEQMLTQLNLIENDHAENPQQVLETFNSLQKKREQLLGVIESEAPQRILEERQLAREDFDKYRAIVDDLDSKIRTFQIRMAPFDPKTSRIDVMQDSLSRHQGWIGRYSSECVPQCDDAAEETARLEAVVNDCYEQIAKIVSDIGSHAVVDRDSRALQPGIADDLIAWKNSLLKHLHEYADLLEHKPVWQAEFDDFRDAAEASSRFEQMTSLADGIGQASDGQQVDIKHAAAVEADLDRARQKLKDLGVPIKDFSKDSFSNWRENYIQFRQLPVSLADKFFNRMPVIKTQKLKLRKSLLAKEAEMFKDLPASLLPQALTKLDDTTARDTLIPHVDAVLEFVKCKESRDKLAETKEKVRRRHRDICAMAESIDINATALKDADADCEIYLQWGQLARQKASVAKLGSAAWDNRCKTERAFAAVQADLNSWKRLARFNIVFDAESLPPVYIDSLLQQFMSADETDRMTLIQKMLVVIQDAESWNLLRDRLRRGLEIYRSIDNYMDQILALPTRDYLIEKWFASLPEDTLRIWPSLDAMSPVSPDTLSAKVADLLAQVDAYEKFKDCEYTTRMVEAQEHKQTSIKRMDELIAKLPEQDLRDRVKKTVELELTQGTDPNNTLDTLLAEVDPQVIGGKLKDLDQLILETWLSMAKLEWWQRSKEQKTGLPLTQLKDAYSAVHNGLLHEIHYAKFRSALPTASCWVATAQSSMSIPMLSELFDIVMIDEASQCTITNILPFAYRAKRLVVIGDAMQLPAIPNISEAQEADLAKNHQLGDFESSQFAHFGQNEWNVYAAAAAALPAGALDVQMLLDHFRCHPAIISFSNRYIYNEALKLCKYPDNSPLPCAPGVNVRDVANGRAAKGPNNVSWINAVEATIVRDLVRELLAQNQEKSIGVITAFKGQKKYLENLLTDEIHTHKVMVDTAHGFQGDERDIIVYSPVVSSHHMTPGTINWVEASPNLINVAVTRARNAFFFVGNLDFCSSLPGYLGKLAAYCKEIQIMQIAGSQPEVELYGWMLMRKWGHEVKVHHAIPRIDQELDFFINWNGRKVAIEVNGEKHHRDRRETDNARIAVLRGQGIASLHFDAVQIQKMPFNVIKQIEDALGITKSLL